MSHKKSDLGQCLYKSRFGKSTKNIKIDRRKPMKSVLEESDLQKIFSLGALADKDFSAIRVINDKDKEGILSQVEKKMFEKVKTEYSKLLSVPRRPKGARFMTKEELLASEKENFLNWRRQLAEIENDKRVKLTPYELNLDFWRQLWRVIERSDILIQVVDARNPLLFRSEDLELYVKEVDKNKINVILINKADLLTAKQREIWAEYFDRENIRVIFWSAKIAEEKRKIEKLVEIKESENEECDENSDSKDEIEESEREEIKDLEDGIKDIKSVVDSNDEKRDSELESEEISGDQDKEDENLINSDCCSEESFIISDSDEDISDVNEETPESQEVFKNSTEMIGVEDIVKLLESFEIKNPHEVGKTTVGLVGYPNVGKSSTINAIFGRKKVSVSATPGHTKRFQTLNITDKLTFCDCPGLVMPSVVHSKGHLMVSGILPIDTIRDYIAPINIIAEQFPRETLELLYGIQLPEIRDGEDPNRPPTAREVLSSYSYMHGMMTSKGNPNLDRAARIILKDYVDGKLLYRHAPPNVDPIEFQSAAELPEEKRFKSKPKPSGKNMKLSISEPDIPIYDETVKSIKGPNILKIKRSAMRDGMQRIAVKEVPIATDASDLESNSTNSKPWRQINKRGTKEKMRNKYSSLDQHNYVYF